MLMQLELLTDFDDIIQNHIPLNIIPIYESKELDIVFPLKEQYTNINEYLENMCFCHTNSRPLIEFNCNDNPYLIDKHDVPQECVSITDKHIVIRMPMYNHIDPSSVVYGGMYNPTLHRKIG